MKHASFAIFATLTANGALAHPGHPVVAPGAEGHGLSHVLIGVALMVVAAGVWAIQRRRAEG